MNTKLWIVLSVGFASLGVGTVMVFLVLDRHSHSASDTVRPFLITMLPVWAIAIAGARVLLGRKSAG